MRTTLDLDDSVLEAARLAAQRTRRSIGAVISEWAQRGSVTPAPARNRTKSKLPRFPVPPDSPPIDLDVEKKLLEEDV